MAKAFQRPKTLIPTQTHYCPGCGHGIVHRILAEVIDELGVRERIAGAAPVGCSALMHRYMDCDMYESSHGRAPAVMTGFKRVHPDKLGFTYQGDGDLAAIGTAEIVHAAGRGEKFTVIFVNNAIYGMTGGQMAPTTLIGQRTTTSPYGRTPEAAGYPIRMAELLSTLEGAVYIARVAVNSPRNVIEARRAIKRAFEVQIEGRGFSMVEVLSPCPTDWRLSPSEAMRFIEEKMIPYYPLGEFKKPEATRR
ncbi:2-oxoglutarate oxidoreductase [miscellaneous Crenarchaeota group-15 archaeon DG-45]|uniref:2-oxoglutarate oxidoreductase n=1 Tax=miscellaneous Crenarchaeota group-15 archaeon DG-45 TaxID=1685127 RepID=A0A0M0BR37_9ARCH|nr:MAG: 2-oxoglutarate oxidoreductase [miscellaneous Crenarchaeota group-15 archaeon DG-45]